MTEVCASCGAPASFSVLQDGVQTPSCSVCADRLSPGAGLSSLAAAFYRTKRMAGVCPNCGTTQESAIETGLVGCPLCYEMLDNLALSHFGVARGAWSQAKAWSLS